VFPNATDATFLEKLHAKHTHNPKYDKPRFDKSTFAVQHYAGQVTYQIEGWLDKNKDPLANDLMLGMQGSDDDFVAALFSDELNPVQSIAAAAQRKKAAAFNTVGFQYKVHLSLSLSLSVCLSLCL
jgi:myosin heavy subunit